MLELPNEYILSLEEVLEIKFSNHIEKKESKEFLHRVASSVSEISHGLTKDRESFVSSRYFTDTKLARAYLTYYTTTNLLKLWPPLRELAVSHFFRGREHVKHLDIGSGTGAAIWGLATYLRREQPIVTQLITEATDSLSQNLKTIERFASEFQKHIAPLALSLSTFELNLSNRFPDAIASYDLITLMNVLNEVDESRDEDIIAMLRDRLNENGAIIMIEPATREESRRALRFRDQVVAAGLHVYAPCCRTGGCPALRDENNWCHTEIRWQRPKFIEVIDDMIGTLRLSLKSTYAVFLKEDRNLSDCLVKEEVGWNGESGWKHRPTGSRDFYSVGRVVSERFDEKGRTRIFICNERGRAEYVMNKRDTVEGNKAVLETWRYDLIEMENIEVREYDSKIGKDSVVNILSNAEGWENVDNLPGSNNVDK